MKKANLFLNFLIIFSFFINGNLLSQTEEAPANGDGTEASPYEIANLNNLYWLSQHSEHWDKHYIQTEDINATDTENWDNAAGFSPIGEDPFIYNNDYAIAFTGVYNGDGKTISNLKIYRPETNNIGLFHYVLGEIKNLGLIDVNITGSGNVGALVVMNFSGTVSNSYSTGEINGNNYVGGLVGISSYGEISNSYSTVEINGNDYVGGLVGISSYGEISNSYSTGEINGNNYVGGLVGISSDGEISNSYSTGEINGNNDVGGLVGILYGEMSNSYSTGEINGNNSVGGLVGSSIGEMSNSYSTGKINGNNCVGGLVGAYNGEISNSYSTGEINGNNDVGGLVGAYNGEIINSFWNTETSGQNTGVGSGINEGAIGKTTAEMKLQFTYVDWDFTGTWKMEADNYPVLQWQAESNEAFIVTSDNNIKIYPNPAKDKLFIKGNTENTNVKIYNLQGQLVLEKVLNDKFIDISQLPTGLYTLKIQNKNNVFIEKLIKE